MTALATLAQTPVTAPETAPAYVVPKRVLTTFTAQIVETRGLLARIAVQLNPYDVRELTLCLETCTLRVVVEGNGFDAGRVAARLDKVIGVLEVSYS
ncbi:hypothetical protein [Kribbella sp. CA-293567]|uniref:hypothetical protein n=1 Tax=Kribbella sp. CA-293567 TaxID=3002436 RepID=UPI0022DD09DD|nr:hypothetical protein [Kribbella sp. CA-293567]WBQ07571.1 hypothetical protein OX958_12380 [Kribbella sp. CA-293567]